MKKFILTIFDSYDTYELEFSNEKELVENIINRKLAPSDFRISEIIDPKTFYEYADYLEILTKEIYKDLEISQLRLKELEKQKEASKMLIGDVYIFDSEIKKELENIKEFHKRLESCKNE